MTNKGNNTPSNCHLLQSRNENCASFRYIPFFGNYS